jgi:sugar lactone lactonase YvrE
MRTKLFLLFALFTLQSNAQTVTTLAGSSAGSVDGTGSAAAFNTPWGLVTDASGNVYVADEMNNRIRKITPAGVVTTFAGGTAGYLDGNATTAKFNRPKGLAIDNSGNIFVVDQSNHKIRKITPTGDVTTFAGSVQGFVNGNGTTARFNFPEGIVIDSNGNLFVVDASNYAIRKITPSGDVTVFAGAGTSGFNDGTGAGAKFNIIKGIAINTSTNDLYVTDGHRIRKITSAAVVTSFAGATTSGFTNGTLAAARFNWPEGIAVATNGVVYVVDTINCVLREITTAGVVSTFVGNINGIAGSANGTGTAASFYGPTGICFDAAGNIYISDSTNHRIRKIDMSALSNNDFSRNTMGVYPNPVQNILNISLENNSEIQKVVIYDVTGKQVKLQEGNTTSIFVEDLKSGFYLLEVTIDGKKEVKKFIKQ